MSIKHWLPLVALLLLPTPVLANHEPRYGSGDIDPYPHSDERFQIDKASGLDTGCTGRSGGPLKFQVPIDRYVGNVKSDGTLANPGLLTEQGVISRTVGLVMPAYDIDLTDGEVDEVYFNGHKLDQPLQGSDGTWYENQFAVPIEWVKFPARQGENGEKPVAAGNEITIGIDINGQGWCTAIDWAQVHFKAMAPLLLIHGTGANPQAAWEVEPGVTDYLTSLGIPFEHRIQLTPNGEIDPNARDLARQTATIARNFGVQKVHLVGHSKGGLDSRRYLSTYYNPEEVRVLSLQTLSTPHQGTVLADISTPARTLIPRPLAVPGDVEMQTFLELDGFVATFGSFFRSGPQLPAIRNLQTTDMRRFNSQNSFPSNVRFYTYGADADLPPRNGNITAEEARSLLPNSNFLADLGFTPANANIAGTVTYHLLRDVSTVYISDRVVPSEIIRIPTTSPQLNDLVVTDNSSKHPSQLQHFSPVESEWLQNNHRRMKNPEVMDRVLERIRTGFPVN